MRFFLCFITIFLIGCHTTYKGPVTDHFDGKKFYYPGEQKRIQNRTYQLISLWVAILQHPWHFPLPRIDYSPLPQHPKNTKITYINHATVLIEGKQTNILIDPIYSYRASPSQWIGPARVHAPGILMPKLPTIDVVLISHNHYDHLDLPTLITLNKRFHPVFIVPLGNKSYLNRHGIKHVVELDWWTSTRIKDTTVTFLPAHHSAQRWLHDYNLTLWGSYGIQIDNKKIYFAGDTGYKDHFKTIRHLWGAPDFSFLPIGAYEPHDLAKAEHLNPDEAVRSHLDLGSTTSMGIHWGTFQLGTESFNQPLIDLAKARKHWHVSANNFFVLQVGIPFYIKNPKKS